MTNATETDSVHHYTTDSGTDYDDYTFERPFNRRDHGWGSRNYDEIQNELTTVKNQKIQLTRQNEMLNRELEFSQRQLSHYKEQSLKTLDTFSVLVGGFLISLGIIIAKITK